MPFRDEKRPFTTGEIAALCHVTINAVKKWIASGKLCAFRTPGGHYRINREDFLGFIEKYKLDIKEEVFPTLRRILIVDDDRHAVDFISGALESMDNGYLVEAAGNGYEALIKVGDWKPELLILDIRMPKLDGFEVCRRLKGDPGTRDIKILAVSAYGADDLDKILRCGAELSMAKPIMLKEFKKNVQTLLR